VSALPNSHCGCNFELNFRFLFFRQSRCSSAPTPITTAVNFRRNSVTRHETACAGRTTAVATASAWKNSVKTVAATARTRRSRESRMQPTSAGASLNATSSARQRNPQKVAAMASGAEQSVSAFMTKPQRRLSKLHHRQDPELRHRKSPRPAKLYQRP
jgi:hypothetical protein